MLDCTDRHDRYFLRLLTANAVLYTEMVTTNAIRYGDVGRQLRFDAAEHPLALQIGGSLLPDMAHAAQLAESKGFDEININVGCPSERVQRGAIGACLMAEPGVIADCVTAMRNETALPVTVKCRTGVDDLDDYAHLHHFVDTVAAAGCEVFIVHARKAWLSGLSPKENRNVPPLTYERVYRLKQDFPKLCIIINGGISTLDAVTAHLQQVDGVMLGREAYSNPYRMAELDHALFGTPLADRETIIQRLLPYVQAEVANGTRLYHIARHVLGLFHGQPGAKHWRRYITEHAQREDASPAVLLDALDTMRRVAA